MIPAISPVTELFTYPLGYFFSLLGHTPPLRVQFPQWGLSFGKSSNVSSTIFYVVSWARAYSGENAYDMYGSCHVTGWIASCCKGLPAGVNVVPTAGVEPALCL